MALVDVLLQVKADTNQARQELTKFASDLNNLAKGLKTVFSDSINVKITVPKTEKDKLDKIEKDQKDSIKRIEEENNLISEQRRVIAEANSLMHSFKNAIGLLFSSIGAMVTNNPFIAFSKEFEKNMYNMNSIALESTENFKMLSEAVISIARENEYSGLVNLSESLYQAYSAGFQLADALTLVKEADRGALAGLTDSKTVLDALVAVIHAYGLGTEDAARINNIFLKTVQDGIITMPQLTRYIGQAVTIAPELKLNLENITAAYVAMTRQGLNAAETTTAINSVLKTFLDPSKEAASYAKELGVNLSSSAFEGRNFAEVISEIAQKADEDVIGKIFGNVRAVKGFFKLAKDEGALFEKYYQEMLTGVNDNVEKANEQQRQSFSQALNAIKVEWEAGMSKIGLVFQEGITPILGGIKTLIEWFNNLSEGTKRFIAQLVLLGFTIGSTLTVIFSLGLALQAIIFSINLMTGSTITLVGALKTLGLAFGTVAAAISGFLIIAGGISVVTSLWIEYYNETTKGNEAVISQQQKETENLQNIIELEKKRIAQKKLNQADLRELAIGYRVAGANATSPEQKANFKAKAENAMKELNQTKELEVQKTKVNKEQLDNQMKYYEKYVQDKINIEKTFDEALLSEADYKRKELNLKYDTILTDLKNALTSTQVKTDPKAIEDINNKIILAEKARQAESIKLEQEISEKARQEREKRQREIEKYNKQVLKNIMDFWNSQIDITSTSINKISGYNEKNSLDSIKANNNLIYGFKLNNQVYDGLLKQAQNYRSEAEAIKKVFGETPEYTEAIKKASEIDSQVEKKRNDNKKQSVVNEIKANQDLFEAKKSQYEVDAQLANHIEYVKLENNIKLNKEAIEKIDKILKKGGLTPEQLEQQKKLRQQLINESIKALDTQDRIINEETKRTRDKNFETDLKSIDSQEKLKTLSTIQANEARQLIIKEKIQAFQNDKILLENTFQAVQAGIETEAYKQAKEKLETAKQEQLDLTITHNNLLLAQEKETFDRMMSLIDNFANKLGSVADSLKQNNNGLISSFGRLLNVASNSYATASGYFKDVTGIENRTDLTRTEKDTKISSLGQDTMTNAIISTIGENLPKIIDNTSMFYEKLDNLNKILLTNSTSSKEFNNSLKEMNESISDDMKAIPGFGDMLSKLTRQITDFLGVTDSEKTKAKNKTMLDLEYETSKQTIAVEYDTLKKKIDFQNKFLANKTLTLEREREMQLQALEIQSQNLLDNLKRQGLDLEEYNARFHLLEEDYNAKSNIIELEYLHTKLTQQEESEKNIYNLQEEYDRLRLSSLDNIFSRMEAINQDYVNAEYEIWSQHLDGLITLAEAEEKARLEALKAQLAKDKEISSQNQLNFELAIELEKAKIEAQEDSLTKSLALLDLEAKAKENQITALDLTFEQRQIKIDSATIEHEAKLAKIYKESREKIQGINEKNYKEELKIIDKVYGEETKKLQKKVDKELDIIKKAEEDKAKLLEDRKASQEQKDKIHTAFTEALQKRQKELTASFYTMNEEEASKGNVKIVGDDKQFKGFETIQKAVLNEFETTSMTIEERNKRLSQNAIDAFAYYQNLLDLEQDPNRRVAVQDTLDKWQKAYYDYSVDKELEKIDAEKKAAEKKLKILENEKDSAYKIEQDQISKLNALYLDSAGVYKTAFVDASREWLSAVKNGLMDMDKVAQAEIIQSANNLLQNKTEAQKYLGGSSNSTSGTSTQSYNNVNGTSSNYVSGSNTTGTTPTSSSSNYYSNPYATNPLSGTQQSGNPYTSGFTLSSLDTDQRKALLIKYLAKNDPTHTEQYYFDKYFYYDLPTLKSIVQERGVSYLIPQFDQFKDGGVTNKPSIFGEAGAEAAFNYPQMVKMYDYIIKTTGNPINNSSTIINMGGIHIQGTNLADAELVASAVNREFRNFENNIRRSK